MKQVNPDVYSDQPFNRLSVILHYWPHLTRGLVCLNLTLTIRRHTGVGDKSLGGWGQGLGRSSKCLMAQKHGLQRLAGTAT